MSNCSICFSNIKSYSKETLSCKHSFCKDCIANWFSISYTLTCPICRKIHVEDNQTGNNQILTHSMTSTRRISDSNTVSRRYYLRSRTINSPIEQDLDNVIIRDGYNTLDNLSVSQRTRLGTHGIRKIIIINELKVLLKKMDFTHDRIKVTNQIFDTLKANKWVLQENERFKNTVIYKLWEFYDQDNIRGLRGKAQKWYFGIFGESMINRPLGAIDII